MEKIEYTDFCGLLVRLYTIIIQTINPPTVSDYIIYSKLRIFSCSDVPDFAVPVFRHSGVHSFRPPHVVPAN